MAYMIYSISVSAKSPTYGPIRAILIISKKEITKKRRINAGILRRSVSSR